MQAKGTGPLERCHQQNFVKLRYAELDQVLAGDERSQARETCRRCDDPFDSIEHSHLSIIRSARVVHEVHYGMCQMKIMVMAFWSARPSRARPLYQTLKPSMHREFSMIRPWFSNL